MEQLPLQAQQISPVAEARRFWDARFAEDGFVYGEAPNDVLREQVQALPVGDALGLAEGEGRNGVFLAVGGADLILEAYTPRPLSLGTGGPPLLELLILEETRREIAEGPYHHGESAVVRVLARRPIA